MDSKSLCRNLAILAASTILGAIGPSVLGLSSEKMTVNGYRFVGVSIVLLIYGFGALDKIFQNFRVWWRDNLYPPRVGILNGISRRCTNDIPRVYSVLAPNKEWDTLIRNAATSIGEKICIKLLPANSSFDDYKVIINPYGSNYPETNFNDFTVYNKILNYIKLGGLFVNVADIPTYWAYNPILKRMLDRTPVLYGVGGEEQHFFQLVPLMQELALRVRGVEGLPTAEKWPLIMKDKYLHCGCNLTNLKQSRAVIVEGNVESVIDPIKVGPFNMTPIFFCNYGNGRCLISLSFLDGQFQENYPLTDTISKLIVDHLFKEKHHNIKSITTGST